MGGRRFAAIAVAAALGIAGLAACTPPGPTSLNLRTFTDMVIDQAHQHVFVSGDGRLLTLDWNGHPVSTLPVSGATGLALSPSTGTLYVGSASSHAVTAISTSTLQVTHSWSTPAGTYPNRLTLTGGSLWMTLIEPTAATYNWRPFAVLSPTTGALRRLSMLASQTGPQDSLIVASPSESSNLLVIGWRSTRYDDDTQGPLDSYQVSGSSLTHLVQLSRGIGLNDLAFSPDGRIVTPVTTGGIIGRSEIATGRMVGAYDMTNADPVYGCPVSGSYTSDSRWFVAGSVPKFFQADSARISFGGPGLPGCLADYGAMRVTGDGTRLFAVYRDSHTGLIGIDVLNGPEAPGTPAPPAPTGLGLDSFSHLAVDNVHKRLFISPGDLGNEIVATDFSGRVIGWIRRMYGADGLVLSSDNSTLYAALGTGDAIAAIDTATLTERWRKPLTGHSSAQVALAAGRMWSYIAWKGQYTLASTSMTDPTAPWVPVTPPHFKMGPMTSVDERSPYLAIYDTLGSSPDTGAWVYRALGSTIQYVGHAPLAGNLLHFAAGGSMLMGQYTLEAESSFHDPGQFTIPGLKAAGTFAPPDGMYPESMNQTANGRYVPIGSDGFGVAVIDSSTHGEVTVGPTGPNVADVASSADSTVGFAVLSNGRTQSAIYSPPTLAIFRLP